MSDQDMSQQRQSEVSNKRPHLLGGNFTIGVLAGIAIALSVSATLCCSRRSISLIDIRGGTASVFESSGPASDTQQQAALIVENPGDTDEMDSGEDEHDSGEEEPESTVTVSNNPSPTAVTPRIPGPTPAEDQMDPVGVVYGAPLPNSEGEVRARIEVEMAGEVASLSPTDVSEKELVPDDPDELIGGRLHPILLEWLDPEGAPEDDMLELIITFEEQMELPLLPTIDPSRESDTEYRQQVLDRSAQVVQEIIDLRAEDYSNLEEELSQLGVEVRETFWLSRGMLVRMPLESVQPVSELEGVQFIEPRYPEVDPPLDDGTTTNDVQDARQQMASDPYFNLGLAHGRVGVLDTGMLFAHNIFLTPDRIGLKYDCTGGACNGSPDPSDACWDHGTKTGAIISGNDNIGSDWRGLTTATLNSYKVYDEPCGTLDTYAAVEAVQQSVADSSAVIIIETQDWGWYGGALASEADAAFDERRVVIAPTGNQGPSANSVRSPASAHKVIGVGAYNVQTPGSKLASMGVGPTFDKRIKPDIMAPSMTETASRQGVDAHGVFYGTSGAAPYAAGAASLLRAWLRGGKPSIDPGQVYAQLILSGQEPGLEDTTLGAGELRLPTNGYGYWGKVEIGHKETLDITIPVVDADYTLDAALWWPESVLSSHSDLDLQLIDPQDAGVATSESAGSVFERARVEAPLEVGNWRIQIRGHDVPSGAQVVYWTVATWIKP